MKEHIALIKIYTINNMLGSMKILRSDWFKTILFIFLFPDEKFLTSPRPLHSDLICATLPTTRCGVTVMLFIDKTILREYFLSIVPY